MRTRVRLLGLLVAVAVLAISACSAGSSTDDSSGETSQGPEPYTGYPDSMAVLGHSQATGENTVPFEGGDTKSNTWASGTNPEVRSVYLRIREQHPAIDGHVQNYAEPSATIQQINIQAQEAAPTQPDLVLVQAIDADIACPATDTDYEQFGEGVTAVLDTFAEQSPSTRVFFVSQFGSPKTYAAALTAQQRREYGARMGGPGPCAFLDATGEVVPRELDRLEKIIRAYEQQMAEVCDARDTCAHDHGAFSEAVDRPGDYTDDLDHLSLQGHARAAQLAWRALQEDGLVPRR